MERKLVKAFNKNKKLAYMHFINRSPYFNEPDWRVNDYESHWILNIATDHFFNKTYAERETMVREILKDELKYRVEQLNITAFTREEFRLWREEFHKDNSQYDPKDDP